jgi:two-component system nitrogen regulation response regulator GlnG
VALGAEADRLLAGRPGAVWDSLAREFERTLIRHALLATAGRRIEAAQLLGIGRNTITQDPGAGNGKRQQRRAKISR